MFGYVRLHKPTIRMGEYEQYRGVYCTLCKRLGKRYGLFSRMSLSYDLTFLALLHLALSEEGPDFCPGRCSFNPTKQCLKCRHTAPIDRAADLSALLTYHKLRDTVTDESFFKKLKILPLRPFAAIDRRRAAKRWPQADRQIGEMMDSQRRLEADKVASVDRAAEPFALLLQWMAADIAADERQRTVLSRFGYCLGRWVYLIDAVDDMGEDLKKGNYNPYVLSKNIQKEDEEALRAAKAEALFSLNACLAECIAAYNLLEIRRFDGILRNILEEGMPAAQQQATSGEEHTHDA